MVGKEASAVKTANALVAVHTLLKPYKYFQNPGMDKEAAPPELEAIVKALLEPFSACSTFSPPGRSPPPPRKTATRRRLLARRQPRRRPARQRRPPSHPPQVFPPHRRGVHAERARPESSALARGARQTFGARALVENDGASLRGTSRARGEARRANAHLARHPTPTPRRSRAAAGVRARGGVRGRHRDAAPRVDREPPSTASRLCALCFDLLARVSETAAGFRLLAPDFGRLLETAVFPALCASPEDETDWDEDEEEYLQKNLPTDADDPTGFNEELYAPRQSAANLLGLLAERGSSGGAPGDDKSDKNDKGKRKKGGAKSKSGARRPSSSPGDVTLRFLERFAVPTPSADIRASSSYYGALVAYGALAGWLGGNAPSGTVNTLARQRVLPALEPGAIGESTLAVMIRANACWALGELAATEALPETLAHAALLRQLTDPAGADAPALRSAAASATAAAIRASCWPEDWTPLLSAAASAASGMMTVGGGGGDDENDASRLRLRLRLIAVAAEAAPEHCGVAAVASPLAASLARAASSRTPPPPATLPPLVETALEALVAAGRMPRRRLRMRTPTSTTTTSPNRRTRISRRWRRISATRSDARGRLRRGVWTRGARRATRTRERTWTRTRRRAHRRRVAWATVRVSCPARCVGVPTPPPAPARRSARSSRRTPDSSASGTRGKRKRRSPRSPSSPTPLAPFDAARWSSRTRRRSRRSSTRTRGSSPPPPMPRRRWDARARVDARTPSSRSRAW